MNKKGNMIGVIVIGGHVQALNIVRIYGKLNIPCIVLDNNKLNLAKHSKFCNTFIHYDKDNLLENLLLLGGGNRYKDWLLIPTNDKHVEILSKNKETLNTFFKVSSDNWDVIEKCTNKRLTYAIAKELKIPFAKTWLPNNLNELAALDITFPCIIKPAVMHSFYEIVKKKVFVCKNKNDLFKYYSIAIKIIPPEEIIIQDIIPGVVNNQFSACFMFDGKIPLVSIVAMRRRQHPISFGNATTYAETIQNDILIEYGTRLLRHINYKGICEVEFMFDYRDNTYKFLEINARTWKWHSIATLAKTPFLLSLYHFLINNKLVKTYTWEKVAFRHVVTDLPIIFQMKMKNIYEPAEKRKINYAVWDLSDSLPAFFELLYLPINIFKR
jgi:D-aspartate ligase